MKNIQMQKEGVDIRTEQTMFVLKNLGLEKREGQNLGENTARLLWTSPEVKSG